MGGNGFLLRIGIIVGIVVVLFIIAAVVISSLAPKGSTPGLTAVAERQQEIIRIATAAEDQATSQDTKNFVTNAAVSITSSQQSVITYLGKHGTKLVPKVLALDQSSQTDSTLASAATANNYDSAVAQNLTTQLQTYQSLLQTTYNQTTGTQAKALLKTCYSGAAQLLAQAKALTDE
ncbi:MAG: hypothetical protein WDN27_01400 [Candidatus Saccharibacteria bacterium]